jgi:hypothetical protein
MMCCPSDYFVWLASRRNHFLERCPSRLSPRIQDDVPELWMLVCELAIAWSCLELLVVLDDVRPAFAKLAKLAGFLVVWILDRCSAPS